MGFVFLLLPARMTTAVNTMEFPLLREYHSVVRVGQPRASLVRNVPLKYRDRLQINESLSHRAVVRKNEQSGVKDLRTLCNNAFLEEWWGFFPDEHLWVEMGHDEKIDSTWIDFNYLIIFGSFAGGYGRPFVSPVLGGEKLLCHLIRRENGGPCSKFSSHIGNCGPFRDTELSY